MRAGLAKIAGGLALVLALAACGSGEPRLMPHSGKTGPDEFAIVPTKPLEQPTSYAFLPEPTPGGANRVDATPHADAVAALGGSPAALTGGGIDGGLVNHASRYGRDDGIRAQLATEDLAHRKRNDGRLLDRLFGRNTYQRAYRGHALDQQAELDRLRRAGVVTPTAPPPGVQ